MVKFITIKCDYCKKPIVKPEDHFEFKVEAMEEDGFVLVPDGRGGTMQGKKRIVKVMDFHKSCNAEWVQEYNNLASVFQRNTQ